MLPPLTSADTLRYRRECELASQFLVGAEMTASEIVTTCMSTAALLISLATLYLTYFYKKVALIGRLVAFNTVAKDDPLYGEYEFSLSNTGTLELLISDVGIDLVNVSEQYLLPEISSLDIPIVLRPGQIKLLRVTIPDLFMRNAAKTGHKVLVEFQVHSPKAKLYLLTKELLLLNEDLEMTPDGWQPFVLSQLPS